jgi:hypothetical protein
LRLPGFTVRVPLLRRSAPVAVLLAGFALLGAGVAGVARVDAPLQAAAAEQQTPSVQQDVDVTWHQRRHDDGDCPPRRT